MFFLIWSSFFWVQLSGPLVWTTIAFFFCQYNHCLTSNNYWGESNPKDRWPKKKPQRIAFQKKKTTQRLMTFFVKGSWVDTWPFFFGSNMAIQLRDIIMVDLCSIYILDWTFWTERWLYEFYNPAHSNVWKKRIWVCLDWLM